ncbi:MAG: hypothetical protein HYY78_08855 [Betaproteobacteria bacterium]|nr:hypothetical protein [Betaproteobacteria bacterium]
MIAPARRRLLLAAAFVAALVSAALAPSEEAPPAKRAAAAPAAAQQPQRLAAREIIEVPPVSNYTRSMAEGISVVNIFEPQAPPSVAPAPAKPVAPKPPFTYMGLIEESGRTKVALAQGDQLLLVVKGEQFSGSYRLEEVSPDSIVVTYLPLEERQSLSMGASK